MLPRHALEKREELPTAPWNPGRHVVFDLGSDGRPLVKPQLLDPLPEAGSELGLQVQAAPLLVDRSGAEGLAAGQEKPPPRKEPPLMSSRLPGASCPLAGHLQAPDLGPGRGPGLSTQHPPTQPRHGRHLLVPPRAALPPLVKTEGKATTTESNPKPQSSAPRGATPTPHKHT